MGGASLAHSCWVWARPGRIVSGHQSPGESTCIPHAGEEPERPARQMLRKDRAERGTCDFTDVVWPGF